MSTKLSFKGNSMPLPPLLPDGFLRELWNPAVLQPSHLSRRDEPYRNTCWGRQRNPPHVQFLKNETCYFQFLLDDSSLRGWDCHPRFVSLRQTVCAINWFTASLALSVPQESAFGPELYFYVLEEVLTYLDKGLNLAGCPAAGMDKHEGGMFDIQAPVSEGTAVDRTQSGRN